MQGFVELEGDRLSLRMSLKGGAVVDGHTRDGRRFLRRHDDGAFDVLRSACFPLVPVGNRVEGNGFELGGKSYRFTPNTAEPNYIHGDGWLAEWNVEDASATHVRLAFEQLRPAKSPHVYRAVQTVTLDGATVTLSLSVTNLGNEPLPFGIGFHPYFSRTEGTLLMAPAMAWWTEREGYLPGVRTPIPDSADFATPRLLPRRRLNNCFEGWSGQARIIWPETKLAADIAADAPFSRYMLYAPEEDRSFFCLEPMSHTPNALATSGPNALHLLAPGQTLSGAFSITVSNFEVTQ
ncbi:aldose 1-epimerase [Aminobacter ciceronei]|uniref:Aldose 1-epimerase n=1 Tax=Aminobacter ciceronei TaxID=150723 RepID=A0ABR6CEN5_9HYPH|nr:aldose 1-epimerase [Aminobacter ciceronei]MBA8909100.1 aldose 1-epimerase [Aminobacter ciceronei]MBA9022872.1 aldose 1-epimerase [Aminobacter ciceronei]